MIHYAIWTKPIAAPKLTKLSRLMWHLRLSGLVDLRLYDNVVEYYSERVDTDGSDTSGENAFQLTQFNHQVTIMSAGRKFISFN